MKCSRRSAVGQGLFAAIIAVAIAGCQGGEQPLWQGWKLKQRSKMIVPGLGGEVFVSIGDIRNGNQATLTVANEWGQTLGSKVAMGVGQSVRFEYMLEWYEVTVVRYVDRIAGDDAYLTFRKLRMEPR